MNNLIRDLSKLEPRVDRVYFCVTGVINPDLFSTGIQVLIQRDYSHAAAIYWSLDANAWIITNCTGVATQLDTAEQFFENGKTVIRRIFEIAVDPDQRASFIKKAYELDGTPYSGTRQLIWLALSYRYKILYSPIEDHDKSMWCSEYTDELLRSIHLPSTYFLYDDRKRHMITPRCTVEALEKMAGLTPRVKEITNVLRGVEQI